MQNYPTFDAYCVENDLIDGDGAETNYFSGSPLRWPPEHALLLHKILTLGPWLCSAALPDNPLGATYRALADEAMAMDAATWETPETRSRLRARELVLDRQARRDGVPHYLAPFPDRPDATFLLRPGRRPALPNIDDAWPPDAPWAGEPVP